MWWCDLFLLWAIRRARRNRAHIYNVVRFDGDFLFRRFAFVAPEEFVDREQKHWNRPPWWRPFNAFIHQWRPTHNREGMHDHPRWSITVCLRGKIVEHTPWWSKELRPGSIVIRSRKAIHAFEIPEGYSGKTWTLFIVGPRDHPQNTYVVERRTGVGQVVV